MRQIRSELRKLVTTRSAFTMLAALLVVMTLGVIATVMDTDIASLQRPLSRQVFLAVPMTIVPLFALLLGLRSYTDEFRHGSIVPTLLANPRRGRVLEAKLVATAIAGAVFASAAVALSIGLGSSLLLGRGVGFAWSVGPTIEVAGRVVAAAVLWTAIGVGLGLAVKHQVAAIAGSLIWMIAAEGIIGGLIPDVSRYFPGAASNAFVGIDAASLLAPGVAGAVLVGWAAVSAIAGDALMRRRDVAAAA